MALSLIRQLWFISCTIRTRTSSLNQREVDPNFDNKVKRPEPRRRSMPTRANNPPKNSGKLLVKRRCTPADMKYPTDLGLLNEASAQTESIIDHLHNLLWNQDSNWMQKPRTLLRKCTQRLPFSYQAEKVRKQRDTQSHLSTTALCSSQLEPHRHNA